MELSYDIEIPLLSKYPGEMETYIIFTPKHIYECLYSVIHNIQKVGITQMCIDGWILKNAVSSYSGILASRRAFWSVLHKWTLKTC